MIEISLLAPVRSKSAITTFTSTLISDWSPTSPTNLEFIYQNMIPKKSLSNAPPYKPKVLESYGRIDKYRIVKEFGNKHINRVFLVQIDSEKSSSDLPSSFCVVKTMDLSDPAFSKETQILSLAPHPNIVACKEILTSAAIEVNFDVCIRNAVVLEHAVNGDLYPYLECGPLSESISRFYFGQILEAISHLHDNGYCHLDIKPENLLLDERFNCKLSDFGFAAQIEERFNGRFVKSACGTSSYCPPEAWKLGALTKGYDGTKADIFQCGIMLFIMLTGQPPFSKSDIQDGWFSLVARGRWEEFWHFKEKRLAETSNLKGRKVFSQELRELLQSIFEPQANKRITIAEIKKSKWFTEIFPAEPIEIQFEMINRKVIKKIGER